MSKSARRAARAPKTPEQTAATTEPTPEQTAAVAGVVGFLTALVAEPTEQTAPRTRCGVVPRVWHAMATANGGGCADNLDLAMRDAFLTATVDTDTPKCDVIALRAWGLEIGLWNPKWEARNAGMQRMNLSNRVRAAVRKGAQIDLNGTRLTTRA